MYLKRVTLPKKLRYVRYRTLCNVILVLQSNIRDTAPLNGEKQCCVSALQGARLLGVQGPQHGKSITTIFRFLEFAWNRSTICLE